jgi:hypothetical protein
LLTVRRLSRADCRRDEPLHRCSEKLRLT